MLLVLWELLVRRSCGKGGSALVSHPGGAAKQGALGDLGLAGFDPKRKLQGAALRRSFAPSSLPSSGSGGRQRCRGGRVGLRPMRARALTGSGLDR